jgi:hypothetical protein
MTNLVWRCANAYLLYLVVLVLWIKTVDLVLPDWVTIACCNVVNLFRGVALKASSSNGDLFVVLRGLLVQALEPCTGCCSLREVGSHRQSINHRSFRQSVFLDPFGRKALSMRHFDLAMLRS